MELQLFFILKSTRFLGLKYFINFLKTFSFFSKESANLNRGFPTSQEVLLASLHLQRTVGANCGCFVSINGENCKVFLGQEANLMPLPIIQPRAWEEDNESFLSWICF